MDELLYERIKRYQNGQMPESERLAFESQMDTDAAFAAEVATWAAIRQGLQEKGDATLHAELMDLGKQLLREQASAPDLTAQVNPQQTARRFTLPRWVYAAAALVLLLLIALPMYQRLNQPAYASADALYAEYFKQPPVQGVRDADAAPWREAYEKGQYAAVVAALEKSLADSSESRPSRAYLYLGLSHLALQQPQKAITAWQQEGQNSDEWPDAQWYTALAYLKLGDTAQAKKRLQDIARDTTHPWKTSAAQILKKLP